MAAGNIQHMNPGEGESSYATNSHIQKAIIQKALPVLKQTIKGVTNHDFFFGQCFKIADLGCSSSENTLLVASMIIHTVIEVCEENNQKPPPEFQVCLNDLFGNDFNTLIKMLPDFYSKFKKGKEEKSGQCFVSLVPGSFYGRLFPDQSLHLVHSSNSVHWLSKVPEGLESSNGANIQIGKTSHPKVLQAYGNQFQTDFIKFLQMRSKEIVRGGHMVLTFVGRAVANPICDEGCRLWIWELLAHSLFDMVKEGLVRESEINSFNVPIYFPCEDEVRNAIQYEGSFSLESFTNFQVDWGNSDYKNLNDNQTHSENTAKAVRAFTEPLLTAHFGKSIIDGVFNQYKKHVVQHLTVNKILVFNFAISLSKKGTFTLPV